MGKSCQFVILDEVFAGVFDGKTGVDGTGEIFWTDSSTLTKMVF
jgi:hypothetical protein